MKASLLYKVASILILLFAVGHTLGFRNIDPQWGINPLIASMQSIHFDASGFNRTYWDFFVGFGLFVSVLMVFAALVAWQLSNLPPETLAKLRILTWGLVACFAFTAFLTWRFFFPIPVIFSGLILVCLTWAAWLS